MANRSFQSFQAAMAKHPPGIVVETVKIKMGHHNRSCKEHSVCSSMLGKDVVVCLWKVEDRKETAIACYWVTRDGIDCCCIGFQMRHMVAHVHAEHYDGALI